MKTLKQNTKKRRFKLTYTKQLVLAIGLFIAAAFASTEAGMTPWEIDVFLFIYRLPDFLHPFFFAVTQFGSIHSLALLLLVFLLLRRYHAVLRLLLTGLTAYLVTGFAKDIWGRARPHEILLDVVNLDYTVRGPGFPSGHVALATALALVIRHYIPKKYRWIPLVLIVCVAFSRMYLGIHAPLDIIGGFAIGWAAYALIGHVRISNAVPIKKRTPKQDPPVKL